MMHKLIRNLGRNSSRINAKTGKEKDHENNQNHVSLNGEIIQVDCNNKCF